MYGDTRGQSGLDRLVLFLVFVVAVAAITPFVFQLGGTDVRGASDADNVTPTPTGPATDDGIVVLTKTGETSGFGEDTIGVVRVVITKTSVKPLDTASMTVDWIDADGNYILVEAGNEASGADAKFSVDESDGRAVLTFDLGSDDADGVEEFSRRLEAGETVTVALTTGDGKTTTVTLNVPESLGEHSRVQL